MRTLDKYGIPSAYWMPKGCFAYTPENALTEPPVMEYFVARPDTYGEVFRRMGVSERSIDICAHVAMRRVSNFIDDLVQQMEFSNYRKWAKVHHQVIE